MPDPFVCTVINPSDPYTLLAEDFTVAAVAIAVLGNGNYGVEGNGEKSPILFGWDDWLIDRGIPDLGAYLAANTGRVADVLDTVMIGDAKDRADVESMLSRLSPEAREEWSAERHDRRRSSMNDIGARAKGLAESLRKRAELKEGAFL